MKKLMLFGGICYLLPSIEYAHKHGTKVITVDYLSDNIAHQHSDETTFLLLIQNCMYSTG